MANVSEKVLTDALAQLLGTVEGIEGFINWTQAGEDRKDDLRMAVQEAKEAVGGLNCESGTCQRS